MSGSYPCLIASGGTVEAFVEIVGHGMKKTKRSFLQMRGFY